MGLCSREKVNSFQNVSFTLSISPYDKVHVGGETQAQRVIIAKIAERNFFDKHIKILVTSDG